MSADESAIVSEASDVENSDNLPTSIIKDGTLHTSHWDSQITRDTQTPRRKKDITRIVEEATASTSSNPTTATTISSWLSRVQSYGFPADVLQGYMKEEISYEEDETWWDQNLVRIFDPYYDIASEDIETVIDGKTNSAGDPVGQCTLKLSNGDEVYGNFRKGVKQVKIVLLFMPNYKNI